MLAVFTTVPAAGRPDPGQAHAQPQEDADLVHRHDLHVLLERGLLDLVEAQDAGVVDQTVELAELGLGEVRGGGPLRLVGHVQPDEARRVPDLLGDLRPEVLQHVGDHHVRALGREQPRLLGSLTARGAGDQHHAPVQLAHRPSPVIVRA